MMEGAILGAVAGFATALVTLGIPLGKAFLDVRRDARKAVTLLTGQDETEGDGVIPRLRDVEDFAEVNRRAIEETEPAPDVEDVEEVLRS